MRFLTALPVYNEARHVAGVLDRVREFAPDILVVNDGSTDGTAEALAKIPDIQVATHNLNRGYGAALVTAFEHAIEHGYDALVTIDCDGQHEPRLIPSLVAALAEDVDIVSGSRYLDWHPGDSVPPTDRRHINYVITQCLNARLGFALTDSFCGFKAYRTSALKTLDITVSGYAMPLQLWVQAAVQGLKIIEFPVPLIYLDEERSFGGSLDDARIRLAHYRKILGHEFARFGFEDCPCEAESALAGT